MTINEQKWREKYRLLKEYVRIHRQFPDKKKVENRYLLNWWKYNKKKIKEGKIKEDRRIMLEQLSNMRDIHL